MFHSVGDSRLQVAEVNLFFPLLLSSLIWTHTQMHACWAVSRKSRRSPFLCPPNSATLMQTSCLSVWEGKARVSSAYQVSCRASEMEKRWALYQVINQHSEISRSLLWLRHVLLNLDLSLDNTKQQSSRGLGQNPQHISHHLSPRWSFFWQALHSHCVLWSVGTNS